jgi:hypothetical protein
MVGPLARQTVPRPPDFVDCVGSPVIAEFSENRIAFIESHRAICYGEFL